MNKKNCFKKEHSKDIKTDNINISSERNFDEKIKMIEDNPDIMRGKIIEMLKNEKAKISYNDDFTKIKK